MGSAVLYDDDVLRSGWALSRLPGVRAVIADPIRHQLVVRFDPQALDAARVRQSIRQPPSSEHTRFWVSLLSRVADILPALFVVL